MVPNIIRKNTNKSRISNNVGNEFSRDWTNFLIPGMELIVLNGRKIRITLIALILLAVDIYDAHPRMTTIKSS